MLSLLYEKPEAPALPVEVRESRRRSEDSGRGSEEIGKPSRLSETDWNHLPIVDQICSFLGPNTLLTKAKALQNS